MIWVHRATSSLDRPLSSRPNTMAILVVSELARAWGAHSRGVRACCRYNPRRAVAPITRPQSATASAILATSRRASRRCAAWHAIIRASSMSMLRGVTNTRSERPILAMARHTEPTLPPYSGSTRTIRMLLSPTLTSPSQLRKARIIVSAPPRVKGFTPSGRRLTTPGPRPHPGVHSNAC